MHVFIARHATQKSGLPDDLFSIRTNDFAAKLWPPLQPLLRLNWKQKRRDDELGTHFVIIEGNEVKNQEPVTTPAGNEYFR